MMKGSFILLGAKGVINVKLVIRRLPEEYRFSEFSEFFHLEF